MNSVPAPAIERVRKSPRHARPHLPGWLAWLVEHRAQILAVFAFAAIVLGGLLHAIGEGAAGQTVWAVAVAVLAAELTLERSPVRSLSSIAWAWTRSPLSRWWVRGRWARSSRGWCWA